MTPKILIVAALLLTPLSLYGQEGVNAQKVTNILASEIETVISEADKLDNKNAVVNVKVRAATLISISDPARSEKMLVALWKFTNEQTDNDFDKESARLLILKHLFSRNPKLARQLLSESSKPKESMPQSPAKRRDEDERLTTKLASQLVDTNPSVAAGLLEESLSMGVTPAGVAALFHLRERDSFLTDYIVTRVLERMETQPTMVSLPGIHLLGAYVFPAAEAPIASTEAQSSLELLQFRYFVTGYEVLRGSLTETNEALLKQFRYTERDLQFRAAFQAQVAAILSALAPRFQPSLAVELSSIAGKLGGNVPANIPRLSQFTLSRISGNQTATEDPEMNFFLAISRSDFDEAATLLERIKDGEKKDAYTQLLVKTKAKALLAKSDVMGAVSAIRKLQDQTSRLVMYLEALKVAKKSRDPNLGKIVIDEARLLVPQTERNGLHARALLSFAEQMVSPETMDDAFEFLNSAVVAINGLGKSRSEDASGKTLREEAMAQLNDANSLLDAPEMERAFSSIGFVDPERGLALANRIETKSVQLVARLESIQNIIKRPNRAKAPAKSPQARPEAKP